MELVGEILLATLLLNILKWLVVILAIILVLYLVIKAICRYQAKEIAKAFDYDYLAIRTAEETCKRLMIIEEQKAMAYKGATNITGDQSQGDRDGAPEQNESRQE